MSAFCSRSFRIAAYFFLGLFFFPNALFAQTSSQIEITYIGNEGFLISDGRSKILIDALYGPGLQGYMVVPKARRDSLEKALPPFDDVDLVLATHYHGDHFNPRSVGRYLLHNTKAVFISTAQAGDRLANAFGRYEEIASRVKCGTPPEGKIIKHAFSDFELEVFFLHHGRGRTVQNLGFLLKIGGRKILHIGDTEANAEDFRLYDLLEQKIDIGLIPSWYLQYPKYKKALREAIQPAEILVMHLSPYGSDVSWVKRWGGWDKMLRDMKTAFPNARFALKGTEKFSF